MRIFTIESGRVHEGAEVITFALKNADVTIPAIIVGEEGRGRQLGVLPVKLTNENYNKWKDGETVTIHHAKISETRAGKPKLIELEKSDDNNDDKAIIVFRTKIGFRGSNDHTGDGDNTPFPGEILVNGVIAQGDAGRMGSGDQLIAVIPKNVVFSTKYYGRLYGAPSEHFYIFDGDKIISVTKEERELTDIF